MQLEVEAYKDFRIVRGDRIPGGVKRLAFESYLTGVQEEEVACAVQVQGHSQLALGLAAQAHRKSCTLFYAEPETNTYVYDQTAQLANVETHFFPRVQRQFDLEPLVNTYSNATGAHAFCISNPPPTFVNNLIDVVRTIEHEQPKEVWLLSGSGTTARALYEVWPDAQYNIVNMGFTEPTIPARVFSVREATPEPARNPPPYQSATYYDAKLWYFVKQHANPRALIWNMAG
ncbi:MAG: hypothetical protein OXR66_07100 [Candidatus Woesearchaeota archaeon]|nr:hypothetical protein [Candidatus Woesearchaeota archaeon]